MHIGMRMQPPRAPVSIIAQAIGVLRAKGGSWWQPGPAYTFTGSDGTGAAGDGSDAGYVRDLCGNARPLTQSTTGFKPKLKRVPKKLGSALTLTAGADVGSTGRYTPNGLTGGVVASGAAYATIRHQLNLSELRNGASYQISLQAGAIGTAGGLPNVNLCDTPSYAFVNAGYISVVQSRATYDGTYKFVDVEVPASSSLTYSSLTVREVVEWAWAWVFDGVDDVLATVAQPAAPAETLIICADVSAASSDARSRIDKGTASAGFRIYGDSAPFYGLFYATDGAKFISITGSVKRGVATFSVAQGAQATRINGVPAATQATDYVSALAPITVGSGLFGATGMEVFAAAYCPGQLSAAERLIVERAMAQVGGITI